MKIQGRFPCHCGRGRQRMKYLNLAIVMDSVVLAIRWEVKIWEMKCLLSQSALGTIKEHCTRIWCKSLALITLWKHIQHLLIKDNGIWWDLIGCNELKLETSHINAAADIFNINVWLDYVMFLCFRSCFHHPSVYCYWFSVAIGIFFQSIAIQHVNDLVQCWKGRNAV